MDDERSDPWRWYCRLCGATGAADSDASRDQDGFDQTTTCGPDGGVFRFVGAGRLLHVWKTSAGLR